MCSPMLCSCMPFRSASVAAEALEAVQARQEFYRSTGTIWQPVHIGA